MKIVLLVIIIMCFGYIGYRYKNKLLYELNFLKYLYDFHQYYASNINLFKNNVVEIIDNYIITQKNKNANYNKIFRKNNNIYAFDNNYLNICIKDDGVKNVIFSYLNNLGKSEYEFEKERNLNIENYLKTKIEEYSSVYNIKGNLYFKLLLAIGSVVAIVLW